MRASTCLDCAADGKPLSGDMAAFEGAIRSMGLVAAPSSVGTHADANTKRAAVDCFGEWSATRPLSVESSRPTRDRVVVVETIYAYRRSELQAMYAKFEADNGTFAPVYATSFFLAWQSRASYLT